MNYGMPYQGSKNRICKWLMEQLPSGDVFVDLLGGGGAVTHAAILSKKYKQVIYNDSNTLIANAFQKAVNGEFKNETRWISREDFFQLKDIDPYVAMCFSFGNDCRTYAYSKEKEAYKKTLHELIVNRNWKPIYEISNGIFSEESLKKLCELETPHERRIAYKKTVMQDALNRGVIEKKASHYNLKAINEENQKQGANIEQCQWLEALERLVNLERLDRFNELNSLENKGLTILNKDYREVEIPKGAIVYCDPPYKDKKKYKGDFNHEEFYNWLRNNPNKIYISEYSMPDDFVCVAEKEKFVCMAAQNRSKAIERIFVNRV